MKQFLCTGEVLLHELGRMGDHNADYSAIVIEYSKALELQLAKACFDAYRADVLERGRTDDPLFFDTDATAAEMSPGDRQQVKKTLDVMRRFVLDQQALTLGQMWNCLIRTRKQPTGSPALSALAAFCQSDPALDPLLSKEFVSGLGAYIESFRNAAAHTKPLNREQAIECRDALLKAPHGLFLLTAAIASAATA